MYSRAQHNDPSAFLACSELNPTHKEWFYASVHLIISDETSPYKILKLHVYPYFNVNILIPLWRNMLLVSLWPETSLYIKLNTQTFCSIKNMSKASRQCKIDVLVKQFLVISIEFLRNILKSFKRLVCTGGKQRDN